MAEDKEVIEKIKNDPTSPFWASTDDEISKRVNGLLQPGTNQFSNEWHAYSKNSHAYNSALKFYNLSKADRDAVVMFLRSI